MVETTYDGHSTKRLTTFVIHYSKLKDRKESLIQSLPLQFSANWITEKSIVGQKLKLTDYQQSRNVLGVSIKTIASDLGVNSRSLVKPRVIARIEARLYRVIVFFVKSRESLIYGSLPSFSKLPKAIIEVSLMHLEAFRIAEQISSEWILVLEDDALLPDNFYNIVQAISLKYARYPIWINLNSGAELKRTKFDCPTNKLGIFRVRPPMTRCTTAYMVNRKYVMRASAILKEFGVPNFLPIDFLMSVMNRAIKSRVFWSDPPIVLQGSESGNFKSSLNKARLAWESGESDV